MENSKKRIVILTPGFPAGEADTNCIPFQQSLIVNWKELYPDIELIVLALQYPYHSRTYSWQGFKVFPFNGRNKGSLHRLWLREKIKKVLQKLNSEKQIDGLLSFWYNETAWAGHWMSKNYEIPHYCWLWGQDAKKENPYPSRLKLKIEELIALSDSLQERFEKEHGIRPFKVITPGINASIVEKEEERVIDVLGVGSLIPLKKYGLFIETIIALKKRFPAIKALLIGEGPERERLEDLIKRSGLENNQGLTGELPHEEVLAKMRRSKILLHTSSYEGFSIACLEALYNGMQVISFTRPMKKDIPGWHIVKDMDEMKERVIELLGNYSPATMKDAFPIKRTVEDLASLF